MTAPLLIVDDEAAIRDMLQRHFRYLGHEVRVADSAAAALAVLAEHSIGIVISDIRMPGTDGVALLQEIRRGYPTVRVIMMTGYVGQESILACMRRGADTCVFKPFEDLTQLEAAVEQSESILRRWRHILSELQALRGHGEGAA